MTTWKRVNLRRLTKLGTGHTPSRQKDEYWVDCNIPWLTLADVWQLRDNTRTMVTETTGKISELGLENSAAVLHPAGTVVMSRTASVGFSGILGVDMATSQDYVTWTCGPDLRPRYLLHALRGLRNEILGVRMGSTHQTIYMPDVERISIPLPPSVQDQDRIADFLDVETARIDSLAGKKNRLIQTLTEWEQAEILEAVGDWRKCDTASLRQFGASVLTGPFGTQLAASEYISGGVPVINPTHIKRGKIIPEDGVSVPESTAVRLGRHRLTVGDLVMGRKGDVGRTAIVDARADGWLCGSDSIAIRTAPTRLIPDYLAVVMSIDLYRQQLAAKSTGATMTNVNESILKEFRVPRRSVGSQEECVRVAQRVYERYERLVSALKQQNVLLQEHRQALITAAVTGELEVPGVSR